MAKVVKTISFSVIIPTYNRVELLKRCFNSVATCRFDDIEILVSDNASSDKTHEFLFSLQDSRVRYWTQLENMGPCKNISFLFHRARGNWIICLSDDDYLLPNAIERIKEVVEHYTNVGVLLSRLKIENPEGVCLPDYVFFDQTRLFKSGMESLSHLFWATHVFSGITVRRDWLDLDGMDRHLEGMYPQMLMVGVILKDHPGIYLDENLVVHTIGNPTFWGYTRDFMVGKRLDMIRDMLPGERWKKEREVLIDQIVDEAFQHHMPLLWSTSKIEAFLYQASIIRNLEIVLSQKYWWNLLRFLKACGRSFLSRVKSFLKRCVFLF